MNGIKRIKSQLAKIPYATVYNFQPWTIKKATDLKSSLQEPSRLLKRLKTTEIAKPLIVYPTYRNERFFRHQIFYSSTGKTKISKKMLEHESGLADVFLAFINLYPDYEVNIECNRKFKLLTGAIYEPDAFIELISLEGKKYHFLIEFERTKTSKQIRNDKLALNKKLDKFENYKLNRFTKILYIYAYDDYNVFARPSEYEQDDVKRQIIILNRKLGELIRESRKLISESHLFMAFPDFYRLNEAVWTDLRGLKKQII